MNRLLLAFLAAIFCTTGVAFAQDWVRAYGSSRYEYGYNIFPTADGGFIVGGTQREPGGSSNDDFWVARFNGAGDKLWDSTYGQSGVDETMFAFGQTMGGGGMIGGFTGAQFSGAETAEMYSFDSVGHTVFRKELDYVSSDHFHALIQRREGGYYFAGHSDSKGDSRGDMWLVRLDNQQNVLWEKTYDRNTGEHAHAGIETRDGGTLLFGHTSASSREKWWVVKTDSLGIKQWDTVFSSTADNNDSPYHVFETREGNYAFVGGSSPGSQQNLGTMWLVVMSPARKVLVNKHYGNPNAESFSWSGSQTSDGGYILAGYTTYQTKGSIDMYIVKSDSTGKMQWEKTFGGTGEDVGYDVVEIADGYVACGYTGSGSIMTGGGGDLMVVKIAKPVAPVATMLMAPRNDSTAVPVKPTLSWMATPSAESYRVQVASDNAFTTILVDTVGVVRTTQNVLLQPGKNYWWRVQATNLAGPGPWSETWKFTTRDPLPLPGRVVLVGPADGDTVKGSVALLAWHTTGPEVDNYWLDFGTDPTFAQRTVDSTSSDTLSLHTALVSGTRYWWRVRGGNFMGWGEFSESRSFVALSASSAEETRFASGLGLFPVYSDQFSGVTDLRISLASRASVTVTLSDLTGRHLGTLAEDRFDGGTHTIRLDGNGLPSGTYIVRLVATGDGGASGVRSCTVVIAH